MESPPSLPCCVKTGNHLTPSPPLSLLPLPRNPQQEVANRERTLLEIFVDDILDHKNDEEFVANLSRNTVRYVRLFEKAVEELLPPPGVQVEEDIFDILQQQRQTSVQRHEEAGGEPVAVDKLSVPNDLLRRFEVAIIPSSNDRPKKLREIRAMEVGHLVKVKGMVTRATDVKPRVVVCTYICDVCGSEIYQPIAGAHSFMPITVCPSERCKDNKTSGKVNMQTRGSKFTKYQELRLQELPDQVPVGHIPRSMTVHCVGEQTRLCGPGDIITVTGIFLATRLSGGFNNQKGLTTDTYLDATQITKQKMTYEKLGQELDTETQQVLLEIGLEGGGGRSILPTRGFHRARDLRPRRRQKGHAATASWGGH